MFHRIIKKISYFINSKKLWTLPKKNNLLIIDNIGSDKISKCILGHQNFTILHTRSEVYYWPIIFLSIIYFLKYNFNCYKVAFIKYVKPSLAVTFIDNNTYGGNYFYFSKL